MVMGRLPILSFALSFFFYNASLGIMTPFLQLFLKGKGYSASLIGVMLGVYELAGVLGPIALGALGDRTGHFRRIMSGSILLVVGLFVLQYFNTLTAVAFLLIAPMGFLYKSHFSLIDAYASHTLPGFEQNYGKARLAGSLGFFSAALVVQLTGWIDASSLVSIITGFGLMAVTYAVFVQFLPRARVHIDAAPPKITLAALRSFPPVFWAGIAIVFLMIMAMASHYYFFSLFVQERFGVSRVSGFWAIGPLAEVPFIFFSGYLIRRFNISRLLLVSLGAGTVRLYIYFLTPTIAPLYVVQILHGLTYGTLHTSALAFIRRRSPVEHRGLGIALYIAIGFGLAGFVGSSLGGRIVDLYGYNVLYGGYGLLPLIAMVLVLINRKQIDQISPLPV